MSSDRLLNRKNPRCVSSEKEWHEGGSCLARAEADERQLNFDRDVGGTESQSKREKEIHEAIEFLRKNNVSLS